MKYRNSIRLASLALNDLYGLVPADQRKFADTYVSVLEQALHGYERALGFQEEISSKLHFADRDQALVNQRMVEADGQ